MPEQKDLSTPADWDNEYLVARVKEIAKDNYFTSETEYKVIQELIDRFTVKSNLRGFK